MARIDVPITGAVVGPRHPFSTRVLDAGKSLHPLQRIGAVGQTGMPSIGVPALPGIGHAPSAGLPHLNMPNMIDFSAVTHMNPAARV